MLTNNQMKTKHILLNLYELHLNLPNTSLCFNSVFYCVSFFQKLKNTIKVVPLHMSHCSLFLFSCLVWSFLILGTHQLQSSQTQVLLQIRKHLEYPVQLEIWNAHGVDFCFLSSSLQVNLTCQDNSVAELRITGDKAAKFDRFVGFPIRNLTLSQTFSMDSFVVTLARLTSLRVLSLVSLGIWGPLPDKIHRLWNLEYLDLSSNYLFGSIPPKISTMVMLQTLALHDNFFNGTVPNLFNSLTNLTDLVLSSNAISGKLPSLDMLNSLNLLDLSGNKLDSNLPSLPKGLVSAVLSNNSFSGDIPRQYGQLSHLQHLDVSFNELTGKPPAALFSLPNISYLNLASNLLSGSLPEHVNCGGKLQFVDVSNNRLTGGLPSCLSIAADERAVKFGGNCLSIDLLHQRAESSCLDVPVKSKQSGGKNVGILVGLITGILLVMVLLGFGFILLFRTYCPRGTSEQHLLRKAAQERPANGFSSEILHSARFIADAVKLGEQSHPMCRSFTLQELKEATKDFDDSTILGEGSYGKLYKGILENGVLVAIRCIPSSKKYSIRSLKLRLDLLAKLRHPHLVCLLGHCIDGQADYRLNKVFLIYEYVPDGNFQALLTEDSPGKIMNWSERLAVLIGVARAVQFLQTGVIPGFFNNRLKTHNILVNEHRSAKLSDYGLSIISEEAGNRAENGEGLKPWQVTRVEDDVCSFGFILLESLLGSSVTGKREKLLLDELASCNSQEGRRKLISPAVLGSCSQESLSVVISLTNKCICTGSWSRPTLEDILWNLQYAAQLQETEDREHRFDSVSLR